MKKLFTLLSLIVCCFLNPVLMAQQPPCSGTPGSNTILAQSYSICTGDSAHLNLANIYTVSGITYQWQSSTVSIVGPFSPIPGATLSTLTSGPLSSTRWFNATITCTNSGLIYSVSQQIYVAPCSPSCSGSPAPTSIVPASPTVCANNVANLSISTTYTNSGITYQWGVASSSNTTYSAIPGATLSTYTSGPLTSNAYYSVLITCLNGGSTFSTTNVVSVVTCTGCAGTPASNTVVGSQTICMGSTASMSLANTYTASGITYQWQSSLLSAVGPFTTIPGATLSTLTTGSLNTNMYYNVIVTCTNSSQSISFSHPVNVVSCSSTCVANAGFTLQPTSTPQVWNAIPASTSSIAAVQWLWGDGSSSNTLFTSHQYSAAGMYNICLSVTLTCGDSAMSCATYSVYKNTSGIIHVNVIDPTSVGITESALLNTDLLVYPNPGNGIFSIELPGNAGPTKIEVRNIVGQVVYTIEEKSTERFTANLDLSTLQNGVYFLNVSRCKTSVSKKLAIQK